MRTSNLILLIASFAVVLGCKPSQQAFSKKDIESAQKLIGLEFSEDEIETMHNYLGRNRSGYDSLRKYEIDNETFPALLFDPHPSGYQLPQDNGRVQVFEEWAIDLPDSDTEIAFLPIPSLAHLIRTQKITAERLTKIYIDRIKKYDSQLLSVITLMEETALEQARKADQEIQSGNYKGLLHGIPYGVKDLIAVEGYPTTWGAAPYKDQVIDYTATVVQKLNKRGAILIAKLVSGALARGDVWFGGKTKNPWDLNQGASGSSAGSGSATAAGLVAFSLGTETLGSITSPATRNGVTGLRPTYGRVSRHGVMSLSWSMDKVGPICRSVEDARIVFNAIYGFDPKDPSTNRAPFNRASKDIPELKVAYLKKDIDSDTTTMGKNLRKSLEEFEKMGIKPEAIELPSRYPFNVFDVILRAEAGAFFDELVLSKGVDLMVEQHPASRANSLRQARFIPAVEYLQANRQRRMMIEEIHTLFKDYDVIIAPTFRSRQLFITNLTGHPVISVPNGFDNRNHPTSFTLIGNLYDEESILMLADFFQRKTDFHKKTPPLFSTEE